MSVEMTKRAWKVRGLTSAERVILLYAADIARVSDHPNYHNALFASQATIAGDCELHPQTVKCALKSLVDLGHLIPTRRPNKPTWYLVDPKAPEWYENATGNGEGTGSDLLPSDVANHTPPREEIATVGGSETHPRTIIEPGPEPEAEPFPPEGGERSPSFEVVGGLLFRIGQAEEIIGPGCLGMVAEAAKLTDAHFANWRHGRAGLDEGELAAVDAALRNLGEQGLLDNAVAAEPLRGRLRAYLDARPVGDDAAPDEREMQVGIAASIGRTHLREFVGDETNLAVGQRLKIKRALDRLDGEAPAVAAPARSARQ